jgi:hypothetical protein
MGLGYTDPGGIYGNSFVFQTPSSGPDFVWAVGTGTSSSQIAMALNIDGVGGAKATISNGTTTRYGVEIGVVASGPALYFIDYRTSGGDGVDRVWAHSGNNSSLPHGGDLELSGGGGYSVGNNNGGDILIKTGAKNGSGTDGVFYVYTGNATERLRVNHDGSWGLAGANYGTAGHVLTSNGAGAAPTWQAAAGNVSISGTPANDYLAVWTSATAIEGVATLTYNGTSLRATNGSAFGFASSNVPLEIENRNAAYSSVSRVASFASTGVSYGSIASGFGSEIVVSFQGTGGTGTHKGILRAYWTTVDSVSRTVLAADVSGGERSLLYLTTDGHVVISADDTNTQTNSTLTLRVDGADKARIEGDNLYMMATNPYIYWNNSTSRYLRWDNSNTKFIFSNNVEAPDFTSTSDRRLKSNIASVTNAGDIVRGIASKLVEYDRVDTGVREIGFIAQDLYKLDYARQYVSVGEVWSVNYSKLVAPLYGAVAEHDGELRRLRERIKDLETKLEKYGTSI